MNKNKISTLISASVITATLGVVSQPADAFTLVSTSASWDNVTMLSDDVVGSDGVAADDANLVNFLDADGVSQVRWGTGIASGTRAAHWWESRNWWSRRSYGVRWGTYTDYHGQKQSGWVKDYEYYSTNYKHQSGLGYQGVNDLEIEVGDIFNIGTLTHFNQTITGSSSTIGKSAEFSLNLDLGDQIGVQDFDFTLSIDETLNNKGYNNNGAACAYATEAGLGCSDKINWDFALDQSNSFTHEGEEYSLELIGFADSMTNPSIVTNFISQEERNNSASIFARLVKMDRTQDIPEPASLLGLAGLSIFFARSRKKQAETLTV
ncbi:MAG: choice-of-anchor K domain-containing protein [Cyanobacteria bacterium P01_D01_bin.105]